MCAPEDINLPQQRKKDEMKRTIVVYKNRNKKPINTRKQELHYDIDLSSTREERDKAISRLDRLEFKEAVALK